MLNGPTRRRLAAAAAVLPLALGLVSCAENDSDPGSTDETKAAVERPAGTFGGTKATGDPVKVGVINPENGPHISQPEARIAAEAAVKYANEHLGGIGGRPIEIDHCASKEDPASATSCANQMVQNKVVAVSVLNTGNGASIAPIVTQAGIAYTSYNGTSGEELTSENSFVWTAALPGVLGGMAKTAAETGSKQATLFATDNAAVVGAITSMATPAFDAAGLKVKIVPIPLGTPDVTSNVTAGLATKPGAVGIIGDATMCTATLKGLDTLAYDGQRMIISPCMDKAAIAAVGEAGYDGSIVISGTEGGGSDDPEAQLYRAVMAEYAPADAKLDGAAVTGYQSIMTLIYALKDVEDVTPASVIEAIKTAKDVPIPLSYGGKATCDGKQVPGLTAVCSTTVVGTTLSGSKPSEYSIL